MQGLIRAHMSTRDYALETQALNMVSLPHCLHSCLLWLSSTVMKGVVGAGWPQRCFAGRTVAVPPVSLDLAV